MAQADHLKESSTFERMSGRLQLLSSDKIRNTLKNGQLQSAFWKNVLPLERFNTLKRSS